MPSTRIPVLHRLHAALAVSALCLACVGWWIRSSTGNPSHPGAASRPAAETRPEPSGFPPSEAPGASPLDTFRWSSIENDDYRKFIASLRGFGCPEQTIQDIIIAEVKRLYAVREQPLREAIAASALKPTPRGAPARKRDHERRKALHDLERERNALIKELVGADLPLSPLHGRTGHSYERTDQAIDRLPPDKRERVREIQEAYWTAEDELNDTAGNTRDAAYLNAYRKINQERAQLLSTVLDPDQVEAFDMASSPIADRFSGDLGGVRLTDQELRELYRIRREVEHPYGGLLEAGDADEHDSDQQARMERDAAEKMKALLGEDRYAVVARETDPTWQQVRQLGERFEIPAPRLEDAYKAARDLREASQASLDLQARLENPVSDEPPSPDARVLLAALVERVTQQRESLKGILQNDRAMRVFEAQMPELALALSSGQADPKSGTPPPPPNSVAAPR